MRHLLTLLMIANGTLWGCGAGGDGGGMRGEVTKKRVEKSRVASEGVKKKKDQKAKEGIAVLDLRNRSGAKDSEVLYLTSLLRQAASRLPTSRFSVMTKNNILVLLPPNTKLEDCVGTCAVDTGRRIGAQWILVGEVVRFGSSLRVVLNLHHSKSGELRGSETVKGESLEKLEGPLQGTALGLFSILDPSLKRTADRLKRGFVFEKFQYKPLPELPSERAKTQRGETKTRAISLPSSAKATVVKGIDFGSVDVEGLALYDEALRLDEDASAKPEQKVAKWDAVAARVKGVKTQAMARAEVWRKFIVERDRRAEEARRRAEEARVEKETAIKQLMKLKNEDATLEKKRRAQMDKDWAKLSKLISLRVVSPEDKLNWVEAFVEAYGAVPELNPHIKGLSQWTAKMGRQFDELKEEGRREAERRSRRQDEIEEKLNSVRGIIGYKVKGARFNMRKIPAGNGVASFLMAETEVTQELYEAVMGRTPSKFKGSQRPVEEVSWEDAIVFCNNLSALLGLTPVYQGADNDATMDESANGFRLPFENEWEWAARGGQNFTYAGSDDLDDVGWCRRNSGKKTHPVAQKQANGYGLFDLTGNVWEWTNDDYNNPGEYRPGAGQRVSRGGSWDNSARSCRVASRDRDTPGNRYINLGLRLSRSL